MNHTEHFPLVGDDEPIIVPNRIMELYDDNDLISNIHGAYEDRQFSSDSLPQTKVPNPPDIRKPERRHYRTDRQDPVRSAAKTEPSLGQIAREQAREDLKRKRSASYLSQNKPFKSKVLPKPQPNKRDTDREQLGSLTAAANRLRQDDYILAEIAVSYEVPDNPPVEAKKNSYDFLKTSRAYNYQEKKEVKEKKTARELNLTRFEQKDKL